MEAIVLIIFHCNFHNIHIFENWEYHSDTPQFELGHFSHVTRLDQEHASENISWIV